MSARDIQEDEATAVSVAAVLDASEKDVEEAPEQLNEGDFEAYRNEIASAADSSHQDNEEQDDEKEVEEEEVEEVNGEVNEGIQEADLNAQEDLEGIVAASRASHDSENTTEANENRDDGISDEILLEPSNEKSEVECSPSTIQHTFQPIPGNIQTNPTAMSENIIISNSGQSALDNENDNDSALLSQFLNEILEKYRSQTRAFKAFDKHNKGFIEEIDISEELIHNFGVEDKAVHHEIFIKLANGCDKITKQQFEEIFKAVEDEKQRQQDELFQGMSVVEAQQSIHSPFKDPREIEDVISIFSKSSVVAEASQPSNQTDHFTEDSVYAPVIKKLRQQPNFNEFVRSYNAVTFPKQQQQQVSDVKQHQLFASNNPHQNDHHNHSHHGGFIIGSSPSKALGASSATKRANSPNKQQQQQQLFSSLEFADIKQASQNKTAQQIKQLQSQSQSQQQSQGGRHLSPSFQKNQNSSILGHDFAKNQLRRSDTFLQSIKTAALTSANHHHSSASMSYQSPSNLLSGGSRSSFAFTNNSLKNSSDLLFASKASPSSGHMHSNSLFQNDQLYQAQLSAATPNEKRLSKLQRKVHIGLDSLQSIHHGHPQLPQQSKAQSTSNLGSSQQQQKAMKDIFNSYMMQIGLAPNANQSVNEPSKNDDKFGDILSRLQGGINHSKGLGNQAGRRDKQLRSSGGNSKALDILTGGGAKLSQHQQLSGSSRNNSNSTSNRVGGGGVHGQIQRVKQIQASLTTNNKPRVF